MNDLIDVKDLLAKYSIEQLSQSAEDYYRNAIPGSLLRKPFRLPEIMHLFTEISHMSVGLNLVPGDVVLDFGCGVGWTSRILAACGCNVIGVDVSSTALGYANDMAQKWKAADLSMDGRLEFRLFDGRTLPAETASIDKIFVLDAFHHVPDQAATLREFARVLKPGGVAGFCEPGPNHSKHPLSQQEMRMHTVIENDVVLADVLAHARAVGLDNLRICLSPLLPALLPYEEYVQFPRAEGVRDQYLAATDWRIRNYPLFFLTKEGVKTKDSRGTEGLSCRLELLTETPVRCTPNIPGELRCAATNNGTAIWLGSGGNVGAVNVGFEIIDSSGHNTLYASYVSATETAPGETVEFAVALPKLPVGDYRLRIDLVASEIVWFNTLVGSEMIFDVVCR